MLVSTCLIGTIVATSLQSLFRLFIVFLSWIPLFVFFGILSFMFLADFQNPVDEYFVSLILKACFMLILAALFSQILALFVISIWALLPWKRQTSNVRKGIDFLNAFPIIDIGIFSIAIFFTSPVFIDWVYILVLFMVVPTVAYWIRFFNGPVRNLFVFAKFHKISLRKRNEVLGPFYFKNFIDYFFSILKSSLMPLVFILVVMDFRIILPRLVDAGLSYQAFALFLSLIISLHLLSYKQEPA
jgi:hypothetical protein